MAKKKFCFWTMFFIHIELYMDYSVCNMVAINERFIKAFFNLNLNKVALNYDLHDEKQVYHHIIKTFARISEAKRIKNKIDLKKILKYVSTSLTLVALQEVLILKLLKLQN
ncbi:hypothetical protein [Helicobacter sp. T3_23-1059]